jgi:hypothetical protein
MFFAPLRKMYVARDFRVRVSEFLAQGPTSDFKEVFPVRVRVKYMSFSFFILTYLSYFITLTL